MLRDIKSDQLHFASLDDQGEYRFHQTRDIVHRVGAGDSFVAGLIYALAGGKHARSDAALRFAPAASGLKHSVPGEFNYSSLDEIESLLAGRTSGRIER